LIADVVNYHPFTRGCLRDPEELRLYFNAYNDLRGHITKLQAEAYRVLNLPLLINQRPPSLMSSVHQQCI
jgi:hypothetical protein